METTRYYSDIRQMPMPPNFRYAIIAARGRPRHEKYDTFYMKHPTMNVGKRAKIFSPFDALKGFNDAVESKEIRYVERRELCEYDCEDPNSEAFMQLRRYVTAEGVVMNVDTVLGSITVGKERIGLGDVAAIEIV